MNNLKRLIKLVELTHDFDNIIRKVPIKGRLQEESDSEHTYKLALTCWYIVQKYKLDLDLSLIFKYALSHDLVEIYVGDADTFGGDKAALSNKEMLEKVALEKIQDSWSDFPELARTIKSYEDHNNAESDLVYFMDRIQPLIGAFITKADYYIERKITYEQYIDFLEQELVKLTRLPEEIKELFNELKEYMDKNARDLFYS